MDIFLIGFSFTQGEALAFFKPGPNLISPISFTTLELAKCNFQDYYTEMAGKGFSHPKALEMIPALVNHKPVILKMKWDELPKVLKSWQLEGEYFESSTPVIKKPYLVRLMRPGFLKEFQILDIIQEIEETPGINEHGQVVHYIVNMHRDGELQRSSRFTPQEMKQKLRERGIL